MLMAITSLLVQMRTLPAQEEMNHFMPLFSGPRLVLIETHGIEKVQKSKRNLVNKLPFFTQFS